MIGGIVISVDRSPNRNTILRIQDDTHPDIGQCTNIVVIEKRKDSGAPVEIKLGDSVWWQSEWVMWTPKAVKDAGIDPGKGCGVDWDIVLIRHREYE